MFLGYGVFDLVFFHLPTTPGHCSLMKENTRKRAIRKHGAQVTNQLYSHNIENTE